MTIQRYSVNQHPVQTLLTWIESDEIAIPEIQRPFVWNAAKVRDFIDSLYFGYPVGYLIAWRNPSVRLKDGSASTGKRILIDGQQRVTALLAAMLGRSIVDKNYRKVRITIAFHPGEERFDGCEPRNPPEATGHGLPTLLPCLRQIFAQNYFCHQFTVAPEAYPI